MHQFIDERHVPERADEIENAQAANLRSYWGLSEFGVGLGVDLGIVWDQFMGSVCSQSWAQWLGKYSLAL